MEVQCHAMSERVVTLVSIQGVLGEVLMNTPHLGVARGLGKD